MTPLKELLNSSALEEISKSIFIHEPNFDHKRFVKETSPHLKKLELKGRVNFIADQLRIFLPQDLKKAIPILTAAVQEKKGQANLSGFKVWPLTEFISKYGLDEVELSMKALKQMTVVFTAEFAIRSFLLKDPKAILKYFDQWVKDPNEHVRRLVSEGLRPLLPWGQRLPLFVQDPKITWSYLEALKNDPSEYVRKSVANHINDHSKNHPEFITTFLLKWKKSDPKNEDLDKLIRHASRTLIKKNHLKAFALHGVSLEKIDVQSITFSKAHIKLGDSLEISVKLRNPHNKSIKLILDHDVHLLKANGSHNVKCFKGKKIEIKSKEILIVPLKVKIAAVTTRTYYSGTHYWSLKINGQNYKKHSFKLKV
ncbi:MAG: DNA alkylation repair protein [Pseudobdellovibrio sp.]